MPVTFDRLTDELVALQEKTKRLKAFMTSSEFEPISSDDKVLLGQQFVVMQMYVHVLNKRITKEVWKEDG